jgi:hypothetical protein
MNLEAVGAVGKIVGATIMRDCVSKARCSQSALTQTT